MRSIERAILVVGIVAAATARTSAEPCETATAITMFGSSVSLSPEPVAGLGAEVRAQAIGVTWGRCRGLRHRVEVTSYEAPRHGEPASRLLHLGRYQLAWHGDGWSAYAGLRGASLVGEDARLATPVLGLRAWLAPEVLFTVAAESTGVFAFSREKTARRAWHDLTLEASVVWPATAATRGELRLRARDYRFDAMSTVRDVTATAGVGLAFAARRGMRGVPGFLGVSLRGGDDETAVFVVTELALAVTPY